MKRHLEVSEEDSCKHHKISEKDIEKCWSCVQPTRDNDMMAYRCCDLSLCHDCYLNMYILPCFGNTKLWNNLKQGGVCPLSYLIESHSKQCTRIHDLNQILILTLQKSNETRLSVEEAEKRIDGNLLKELQRYCLVCCSEIESEEMQRYRCGSHSMCHDCYLKNFLLPMLFNKLSKNGDGFFWNQFISDEGINCPLLLESLHDCGSFHNAKDAVYDILGERINTEKPHLTAEELKKIIVNEKSHLSLWTVMSFCRIEKE